jgi:ribosome-associated protein YbcJ (S4-like RNA binding protein)
MILWDIVLQKRICLGGADWRRLVSEGKVTINDQVINDWTITVKTGDKVSVSKRIAFIVE